MRRLKNIARKTVLERTKEYLVWLIKTQSGEERADMVKLPSELDMANQMGVSRTTLRQALSELEAHGMVIRVHGRGTFINSHFSCLDKAYRPDVEYASLIRANGYAPSASFISREEIPAAGPEAASLSLAASDTVTVLKSLYFADRHPCVFNIDWIPSSIMPGSLDEDEYLASVFSFLRRHTGKSTERNLIELSSCPKEEIPEASGLECSSAIVARAVFYDSDNKPLFCSRGYYDTMYIRFHLMNQSR